MRLSMFIFRPSKGSDSMCRSTTSGSDSCRFSTNNDIFYVRVFAHDTLNRVTLIITAENAFSVSEVNKPETTTPETTTPETTTPETTTSETTTPEITTPETTTPETTTSSPSLTETIRKLIYFIYILYTLYGKPAACPALV